MSRSQEWLYFTSCFLSFNHAKIQYWKRNGDIHQKNICISIWNSVPHKGTLRDFGKANPYFTHLLACFRLRVISEILFTNCKDIRTYLAYVYSILKCYRDSSMKSAELYLITTLYHLLSHIPFHNTNVFQGLCYSFTYNPIR